MEYLSMYTQCLSLLDMLYVQISDLHVSVFYDKDRANDLRKFCQETLINVISPEVVLVTGEFEIPCQ